MKFATIKNRMKFGADNENKFLPYLHKYIDVNLKKTENRYDEIDFESDDCLVELKSRTCSSFHYKDTIIGFNKIKRALKENKKCYFVFAFPNGIYSWEFNKEDKDIFHVKSFEDNVKEYAFVPVKKLKCLESFCLINLP